MRHEAAFCLLSVVVSRLPLLLLSAIAFCNASTENFSPPLPNAGFVARKMDFSNVTEEEKDAFLQIMQTQHLKKGEMLAQMREWAKQNRLESKFDVLLADYRVQAQLLRQLAETNMAGFALELQHKFWAIRDNANLSALEECEQWLLLNASLPDWMERVRTHLDGDKSRLDNDFPSRLHQVLFHTEPAASPRSVISGKSDPCRAIRRRVPNWAKSLTLVFQLLKRGANWSELAALEQISANRTVRKAEIRARMGEWARNHSLEKEFSNMEKERREAAREWYEKYAPLFAGPALELVTLFWNVSQREDLSWEEECRLLRTEPIAGQRLAGAQLCKLLPQPPNTIPWSSLSSASCEGISCSSSYFSSEFLPEWRALLRNASIQQRWAFGDIVRDGSASRGQTLARMAHWMNASRVPFEAAKWDAFAREFANNSLHWERHQQALKYLGGPALDSYLRIWALNTNESMVRDDVKCRCARILGKLAPHVGQLIAGVLPPICASSTHVCINDFMDGLNSVSRKQFANITAQCSASSTHHTKAALKRQLHEWARNTSLEAAFNKSMEYRQNKVDLMLMEFVVNLAGPALNITQQIWDVVHNDDISPAKECDQLRSLIETRELEMQHFLPTLPMLDAVTGETTQCFLRNKKN